MDDFMGPKLTETLKELKTNIVFLGYNISQYPKNKDILSGYDSNDFTNFHSGVCDYRLMKAFFELPLFYGAYMTDIYKFMNKSASEVKAFFVDHPEEEQKHFEELSNEISFVCGNEEPFFILSGDYVEEAFSRFNNKGYKYIKVCHYSADGGTTKRIIDVLKCTSK